MFWKQELIREDLDLQSLRLFASTILGSSVEKVGGNEEKSLDDLKCLHPLQYTYNASTYALFSWLYLKRFL